MWWTGLCGLAGSLAVLPVTLGSSLLSPALVSTLTMVDWAALGGLAVSGLVGFVCRTLALRLVAPRQTRCKNCQLFLLLVFLELTKHQCFTVWSSLVSGLATLELVFAFTVEAMLERTVPAPLSILGGTLICGGVLAMAGHNKLNHACYRNQTKPDPPLQSKPTFSQSVSSDIHESNL